MHLRELRIAGLRNLDIPAIAFAPGLNLLSGSNGAGKTSLLEALHLLAYGSSFRSHKLDHLRHREADEFSIFAITSDRSGEHRLGLARRDNRWLAHLDGTSLSGPLHLFRHCAVTCFEPGSHVLISGPAEERRRFLDWGLFHVEHEFAAISRRFRRALRQRNALLKTDTTRAEVESWDAELVASAEPLTRMREAHVELLERELGELTRCFLAELGEPQLRFARGWSTDEALQDSLKKNRDRDLALGYTSTGPHRADWSLAFARAPRHEHLSRGQEKLCAIACLVAQGRLFRERHGEWPIVALDDFCSELDAAHQMAALWTLVESQAQILLTGTEIPAALLERFPAQRRFHVEQGRVAEML